MITLDVNDQELRKGLQVLARAVSDLRPALRDMGELLSESTKQRFAAGEDPQGRAWPANTATTLGRKRGNRPLVGETKSLATTINYRAGRDEVEIGSPMIYSGTQQFGAARGAFAPGVPWGDIPARPFLGLSGQDREDCLNTVRDHLERVFG